VVYLVARHRPGARTIAIIGALLVAGALVGALTGSYDVLIQHRARAHGWAQGGNLMARTVVLAGFMALCGVFAVNSRWRWLYLLGPVFALYALYLTGTRGVFIAVPVLGVIALWALMRELRASRRWYFAGGAVVVVAIGLVALVSKRFSALGSLLEHVAVNSSTVTDGGTAARLRMWGVGIRVFWKSPWIGSGWANFKSASLPDKIYFFHNDFLDMAVAAGVVGIIAWIATIAAPLVGVVLMPRDRFANLRLYCALILSASLFIFGLTDMTLGYDLPTTLHAFLTAIVLGAFREPEPAR
jgi:O-antigen ligase